MDLAQRKTEELTIQKRIANRLLSETDWYVVRNAEIGVAIPEEIATHRSAVREKFSTIENAINACVTEDDFNALFEIPTDDEGNFTGYAIIENWPNKPQI